MLWGTSTYGRGTSTTETGGVPQGIMADDYLKALIREEANFKPMPRVPQSVQQAPVTQPMASVESRRAAGSQFLRGDGMSALEKQARNAQLRDVILAQKAREQGAPRVSRNIGNQQLFTTDPESFNAYQREAYLPGSSSLGTSPSEASRAQANLLSDLAFDQRFSAGFSGINAGSPGGRDRADWYGIAGGGR